MDAAAAEYCSLNRDPAAPWHAAPWPAEVDDLKQVRRLNPASVNSRPQEDFPLHASHYTASLHHDIDVVGLRPMASLLQKVD